LEKPSGMKACKLKQKNRKI